MKWKMNIIKNVVTPVEVEADDLCEALEKTRALIPENDTDHGKVGYTIDTTHRDRLLNGMMTKKVNK